MEFDVDTSKDGVLYLMHGPDVGRTTNGSGPIADLTSEQLDALDASSWFDPKFENEKLALKSGHPRFP